jgi:hypothetical protein
MAFADYRQFVSSFLSSFFSQDQQQRLPLGARLPFFRADCYLLRGSSPGRFAGRCKSLASGPQQ